MTDVIDILKHIKEVSHHKNEELKPHTLYFWRNADDIHKYAIGFYPTMVSPIPNDEFTPVFFINFDEEQNTILCDWMSSPEVSQDYQGHFFELSPEITKAIIKTIKTLIYG